MSEHSQTIPKNTKREGEGEATLPARLWRQNIKIVRRIVVAVLGTTVLLIGVALIVLPGPAFIVIPIGLAILATEFAWARHWLKKVRRLASSVVSGKVKS